MRSLGLESRRESREEVENPGEWQVLASLKGRPPASLVKCRTSTLHELKQKSCAEEKLERKERCKNETSWWRCKVIVWALSCITRALQTAFPQACSGRHQRAERRLNASKVMRSCFHHSDGNLWGG